jgi:hypothetical protein
VITSADSMAGQQEWSRCDYGTTRVIGDKVRREKALDFSGCNSREAADKAASVGGESLPPSVA